MEVEIIIFAISAQWRAFSTQLCLTLVQESLTRLRGAYSRGVLIGGFTVCMYQCCIQYVQNPSMHLCSTRYEVNMTNNVRHSHSASDHSIGKNVGTI